MVFPPVRAPQVRAVVLLCDRKNLRRGRFSVFVDDAFCDTSVNKESLAIVVFFSSPHVHTAYYNYYHHHQQQQ